VLVNQEATLALSIQDRTIGDVMVFKCAGRIVDGEEASTLDRRVRELQLLHRDFVFDLHDVVFVDSAGLGLLVRLLARLQSASGDLKLCGVAPNLQKALRVSRLDTVLKSHDSVDAAIAALYQPQEGPEPAARPSVDILCVHPSNDVVAYLRELLRHAGYGMMATTNTADAVTLLSATRPKIVAIDSEMRRRGMPERFKSVIGDAWVLELPATFSTDDAGEAGQRLLDELARVAPGLRNRG
jgi:anti-anti-sigma factor